MKKTLSLIIALAMILAMIPALATSAATTPVTLARFGNDGTETVDAPVPGLYAWRSGSAGTPLPAATYVGTGSGSSGYRISVTPFLGSTNFNATTNKNYVFFTIDTTDCEDLVFSGVFSKNNANAIGLFDVEYTLGAISTSGHDSSKSWTKFGEFDITATAQVGNGLANGKSVSINLPTACEDEAIVSIRIVQQAANGTTGLGGTLNIFEMEVTGEKDDGLGGGGDEVYNIFIYTWSGADDPKIKDLIEDDYVDVTFVPVGVEGWMVGTITNGTPKMDLQLVDIDQNTSRTIFGGSFTLTPEYPNVYLHAGSYATLYAKDEGCEKVTFTALSYDDQPIEVNVFGVDIFALDMIDDGIGCFPADLVPFGSTNTNPAEAFYQGTFEVGELDGSDNLFKMIRNGSYFPGGSDNGAPLTVSGHTGSSVADDSVNVTPTCQVAGWVGATKWSCCDKPINPGSAGTIVGHAYGGWTVTTAPTCTVAGVETGTCTTCDSSPATTTRATDPVYAVNNHKDGSGTAYGEIEGEDADEGWMVCDGCFARLYEIASAGVTFELVNASNPLVLGDQVIIVGASASNAAWRAMCADQAANNRGAIAIPEPPASTAATATITIPTDDLEIFTVGQGVTNTSAYTFKSTVGAYASGNTNADGYLFAISAQNYVRTQQTLTADGEWVVSFSGNAAVLTSNAATGNRILRYNSAGGTHSVGLFAAYASGQQAIYLYKIPAIACAHTQGFIEEFDGVVATYCNEENVAPGLRCPDCKEVDTYPNPLGSYGATHGSDVTDPSVPAIAGTCMANDVAAGTMCEFCEGNKKGGAAGSTDPDNHVNQATGIAYTTTLVDDVEAEVGKAGYTGDLICDGCGEIVEEGEIIPALDPPGALIASESVKMSANWAGFTCPECGFNGTAPVYCPECDEEVHDFPVANHMRFQATISWDALFDAIDEGDDFEYGFFTKALSGWAGDGSDNQFVCSRKNGEANVSIVVWAGAYSAAADGLDLAAALGGQDIPVFLSDAAGFTFALYGMNVSASNVGTSIAFMPYVKINDDWFFGQAKSNSIAGARAGTASANVD